MSSQARSQKTDKTISDRKPGEEAEYIIFQPQTRIYLGAHCNFGGGLIGAVWVNDSHAAKAFTQKRSAKRVAKSLVSQMSPGTQLIITRVTGTPAWNFKTEEVDSVFAIEGEQHSDE